jgi:ACS family allantoate permease-like MFS transporter
MPAGAYEFIILLAVTWVCGKFLNARTWCTLFSLIVSLLGSSLLFALPYTNKAGLLSGYYIVSFCCHGFLRFSVVDIYC